MEFRIKACDLVLTIRGDRVFLSPVHYLGQSFQTVNTPDHELKLELLPLGDGAQAGVPREAGNEMETYIVPGVLSGQRTELGLRSATREVVSAAIGFLLAAVLAHNQGLLLHAAFLLRDERAYLIVGESGAGKSTLSRNARLMTCVHDDKVAVRKLKGRWWAYGVPLLDNHMRPGQNQCALLAGLYFPEKHRELTLASLAPSNALERLPRQVIAPRRVRVPDLYDAMLQLVGEIPSYLLRFQKDSNPEWLLRESDA